MLCSPNFVVISTQNPRIIASSGIDADRYKWRTKEIVVAITVPETKMAAPTQNAQLARADVPLTRRALAASEPPSIPRNENRTKDEIRF